jgi:hypothetical protein
MGHRRSYCPTAGGQKTFEYEFVFILAKRPITKRLYHIYIVFCYDVCEERKRMYKCIQLYDLRLVVKQCFQGHTWYITVATARGLGVRVIYASRYYNQLYRVTQFSWAGGRGTEIPENILQLTNNMHHLKLCQLHFATNVIRSHN